MRTGPGRISNEISVLSGEEHLLKEKKKEIICLKNGFINMRKCIMNLE